MGASLHHEWSMRFGSGRWIFRGSVLVRGRLPSTTCGKKDSLAGCRLQQPEACVILLILEDHTS